MFITTANTLRMAQPLMDRMEIIRLAGYTEDEKVAIARKHLIIKQIEANGLKEGELDLHDDAVRDLVRYYTREAGVRNLEREIANLARKAIKEILMKGTTKVKIARQNLEKYAGVRRFRFGEAESEDLVGVTTGLAWTEVGGELLTIEAVTLPGKGRVTATGKLGDVMKESVQAANSYVKSRAQAYGIKPADVREARHPRARARGRDAQGRAVGGGRDGDHDRLGADRDPGQARHRDDRRDHLARPGVADRRLEGKAAGGIARRAQDRADPLGEREGPRRDPGQRQARAQDHPDAHGREWPPLPWEEEPVAPPVNPLGEGGGGLLTH